MPAPARSATRKPARRRKSSSVRSTNSKPKSPSSDLPLLSITLTAVPFPMSFWLLLMMTPPHRLRRSPLIGPFWLVPSFHSQPLFAFFVLGVFIYGSFRLPTLLVTCLVFGLNEMSGSGFIGSIRILEVGGKNGIFRGMVQFFILGT